MKKMPSLLSLVLISSTAFGGWFNGNSGLDAAQTMCLKSVNWQTVNCEFKQESEYRISYLRDPFTKKTDTSDMNSHQGAKKRDFLTSAMRTLIDEKGLNQCQTAALVKCVTANFLQYDDRLPPYFEETLYDTYLKERGNCRQFSSVFSDLSKAVGLEVEIVSGAHSSNRLHAFNIVKLGLTWYYLEPQYKDPIFFRPKSKKYLSNLQSNKSTSIYIFLNTEDAKAISSEDSMSATILPVE